MSIEEQLRSYLEQEASQAPDAARLVRDVQKTVRRPRKWRPPVIVAAAAAATIAGVVGAVTVLSDHRPTRPSVTTAAGAPTATLVDYATNLQANQRAQQVAGIFSALDDSRDTSYGGTWISSAGVVVAQSGEASPVLAARLAEARRSDVPVAVQPVAHSLAQLRDLTRQISMEMKRWADAGITISGVGPDLLQNRVVVSLEQYTEGRARTITEAYPRAPVYIEPRSVSAGAAGAAAR